MSHINGWKVTKNKYLEDIEKATGPEPIIKHLTFSIVDINNFLDFKYIIYE